MLCQKYLESLEVVLYIALNSAPNPVSSKDICAYLGVAGRHLETVMQELVHSGILKGSKGPKGGYSLAKEKRRISALDIYEAVIMRDNSRLKEVKIKQKAVGSLNKTVTDLAFRRLEKITLEDLCNQAKRRQKSTKDSDFNI